MCKGENTKEDVDSLTLAISAEIVRHNHLKPEEIIYSLCSNLSAMIISHSEDREEGLNYAIYLINKIMKALNEEDL